MRLPSGDQTGWTAGPDVNGETDPRLRSISQIFLVSDNSLGVEGFATTGVSSRINAIRPPSGDRLGDKYGSRESIPALCLPLRSNHASCRSALNPDLQASTPVAETEKSLVWRLKPLPTCSATKDGSPLTSYQRASKACAIRLLSRRKSRYTGG